MPGPPDGGSGMNATAERAGADGTGRRSPRVVVGVDGSPGSQAALEYALVTAARRGAQVQVVSTFAIQLMWTGGYAPGVPEAGVARPGTERRARDMVVAARTAPTVTAVPGAAEVHTEIIVSAVHAAQFLVEAAVDADLLVVGSRGRGAVRSALLGSVALHCVTHATTPVVVVHPTVPGHSGRGPVIAGIDGSPLSRAVLTAAVEEAARLDAEVVAATTYEMADYWTSVSTVLVPTNDEVRAGVRRGAEDLLRDVLSDYRVRTGLPAPLGRVSIAEGPAADLLIDWARGAEILVVGTHGHGALRGLFLGSVALTCAMHSPCPVLMVRPRDDEDGAVQSLPVEQATASV
ncbi:MAG: UspA [Variovorax sp.]|nr:UspA [Variovorax sp.]